MMKHACGVGLSMILVSAIVIPSVAQAHERKEVADLVVVFGAEPEPALTGEIQNLRWRFQSQDSQEPFGALDNARAVIKRDGKEYGPFDARRARGQTGVLETRHIFLAPGEYEVVLTFQKRGDSQVHTIAFTYQIRDRKELEIPN